MKNLQQLGYVQKLYEEKILSESEFIFFDESAGRARKIWSGDETMSGDDTRALATV